MKTGHTGSRNPQPEQLQNHLYYFRRTKFKYSNEITPLEEKLHKHIFVDGEGEPGDNHLCIITTPMKMTG